MTSHIKQNSPRDAHSYAQEGETFRQMGDIENATQALDAFNKAIEQAPNYAWAIAHRGATQRQLGNWAEALKDFGEAIRQLKDYAWAYAQRGETYREMVIRKQPDVSAQQALNDFNEAIKLDDQYAWAYAHRGATYYYLANQNKEDKKNWQNALEDFTKAIELNDSYAWAYAYRGLVYWKGFDKFEKAFEDFIIAMMIDPNIFPNRHNQLGLLYHLKGQYEEAMKYYKQGLKEQPGNSISHYGIAVATYKSEKNLDEVKPEIDRARAALYKTCSVALYQLASLATLEGKPEEAQKYFQEARTLGNKVVVEASLSLGDLVSALADNDLTWLGLGNDERFKTLIIQNENLG